MLNIIKEKWDKNKDKLEYALSQHLLENDYITYKDLVEIAFERVYNDESWETYNIYIDGITEIDNGDYQGTLLYLLPFETYQPTNEDYLMTWISYGSCSVCDTLLEALAIDETSQKIKVLMQICLNILCNTIKPYRTEQDGFEEAIF
jgi:hypothetical protein